MLDLIKDSEANSLRHARIHTLTYKELNAPLAPLISNQLLKLTHSWKKPQKGNDGYYSFKQFQHLVEEELTPTDDVRNFINVRKEMCGSESNKSFENMFKLSLHACPFVLKERIECSSKYPKRSLAARYATS